MQGSKCETEDSLKISIYIAKLNPNKPWKLACEPVVLSKPELGWANNHTFVDEGPFALIRGDKLYLTFSSAAVDVPRSSGIRRVHFDIDGEPVLDLTEEKDLLPENKIVKTRVVIK